MGFLFIPQDLTSLQTAVIDAATRLIQTQIIMASIVFTGIPK